MHDPQVTASSTWDTASNGLDRTKEKRRIDGPAEPIVPEPLEQRKQAWALAMAVRSAQPNVSTGQTTQAPLCAKRPGGQAVQSCRSTLTRPLPRFENMNSGSTAMTRRHDKTVVSPRCAKPLARIGIALYLFKTRDSKVLSISKSKVYRVF